MTGFIVGAIVGAALAPLVNIALDQLHIRRRRNEANR